MAHQHFAGAELVAIRAASGWLGYPLPSGTSDELPMHAYKPIRRLPSNAELGGSCSEDQSGLDFRVSWRLWKSKCWPG